MGTSLPGLLDDARIPTHVGIIMDGNRRWAANHNRSRHRGHRAGLDAAKRAVRAARDLGIQYLSLYAFSTENWRRAEEEVSFLMKLMGKHLRKEFDFYRDNSVRVVHSGDLTRLPVRLQREIENATRDTAGFDGIQVNLAINYGGRDEIVRSVNRWLENGRDDTSFDDEALRKNLDLPGFPEPDLVIRTGGERRLSNFLIWECAYSELLFMDVLWPDFGHDQLVEAVLDYQRRERKFGGMGCET